MNELFLLCVLVAHLSALQLYFPLTVLVFSLTVSDRLANELTAAVCVCVRMCVCVFL